ncbi:MAG: tryptophan-rich sensory protein [Lachnospiraceae bacterium]|nr:tryptophan-rich sensory protein [Lachnospiraceae bacterium]
MWKKNTKTYAIAILIPLAVGGLAAFLTRNNMDIYDQINKPPLAPPAIVFPIVWTILYILMGVSSARIWLKRGNNPEATVDGLFTYGIQLFFNFFWSLFFFNLQEFFFAFLWLLILWGLILRMILQFRKVDALAAILQIPYLVWVTFAGYLNLMIYLSN